MEWQPPQASKTGSRLPNPEAIAGPEESFFQLANLDLSFTQASGPSLQPNFVAADDSKPEPSPGWTALAVSVASSCSLIQFYEAVIGQAKQLNRLHADGRGFVAETGFDEDLSLLALSSPSSGELYAGTPVFEMLVRDVALGIEWR